MTCEVVGADARNGIGVAQRPAQSNHSNCKTAISDSVEETAEQIEAYIYILLFFCCFFFALTRAITAEKIRWKNIHFSSKSFMKKT